MSNIEEMVFEDILAMIGDNLRILIRNHDSYLYRFNQYCKDMYDIGEMRRVTVDQELLTLFTEESLYALINANFLYDFRDIE